MNHTAAWILRLCAFWLIGSVASARAQGGPPLLTDDPGTPDYQHWEINFAWVTQHSRDGSRSTDLPLLDINYGATERLQIKYEVPWLVANEPGQASRAGLGNSNFGLKWRFFDNAAEGGIAISTFPQLEFNNPTSSRRRGLVDSGSSLLLPVEVQGKLGDLEWNAELGHSFAAQGDDTWIYGLALGRQFNPRLELMVELHGEGHFSRTEDELVANAGARVKLTPHETLLVSAGRSVNNQHGTELTFIGYLGLQTTF